MGEIFGHKMLGLPILLNGLLIVSVQNGIQAQEEAQQTLNQQPQTQSASEVSKNDAKVHEETQQITALSDKIKPVRYPARYKVGVSMRQIAIQMAALIEEDAEYNTSNSIRESIQELSDRLRQCIEQYEKAKSVQIILYYKGCGAEDVTDDFIRTIFAYPVKEKQ